jgi:hypothetical protein
MLENFKSKFQQINNTIPKDFNAIVNVTCGIDYLNGMLVLTAYLHTVGSSIFIRIF